MVVSRAILSCCTWLAALGCMGWCVDLAAADAVPAGVALDDSIDFSGEGSGIAFPGGGSTEFMGGAARFLDRGNSLGGVLEGSGYAPPSSPAPAYDLRQRSKWQDHLNMDEAWPAAGQGPTAADFERALGVRDHGLQWGGAPPADGSTQGPASANQEMIPRRMGMDVLDFGGRGTDMVPEYGARRSLDPVLDGVRSPVEAGRLPVVPGQATMFPQAGRPSTTTADTGSGVRSGLLDPLGLMRLGEDLEVPRTVRGMMDQAESEQARRDSMLLLDQDATRQELNPYLPRMREDFQFSVGDRRLGIDSQVGSPYYGNDHGTAQAARSSGASSLAPAIAMPLPGANFTIQNRRAGQIQFPSRKF